MNVGRIAAGVGLLGLTGVVVVVFPTINKWVVIIPLALSWIAISILQKRKPAPRIARAESASTQSPGPTMKGSSSTQAAEPQQPASASGASADDKNKRLLAAAEFFRTVVLKSVAKEIPPGTPISGIPAESAIVGIHAETAICAAAWMAGIMLFRDFGGPNRVPPDTKPGTLVLSQEANVIGPKAMDLMLNTLNQLGFRIQNQSLEPLLSSDETKTSLSTITFLEAQKRLELWYLKYRQASSLSYRELGMASAIATGLIIHASREVFDPLKGSALATRALVEGIKTLPAPIPSGLSA